MRHTRTAQRIRGCLKFVILEGLKLSRLGPSAMLPSLTPVDPSDLEYSLDFESLTTEQLIELSNTCDTLGWLINNHLEETRPDRVGLCEFPKTESN